jgi:hypothetical protein
LSNRKKKKVRHSTPVVVKPKVPLSKPVDRWLGLAGIAVNILWWLLPRTPLVVVGSLFLSFIVLAHPVWNLPWVEEKRIRRVVAVLILSFCLVGLGRLGWPALASDDTPAGASIALMDIRFVTDRIPAFNFYYDNFGKIPAVGVLHPTRMLVSEKELTAAEVGAIQTELRNTDYWKEAPVSEIEPHREDSMISFYSYPDSIGSEAHRLADALPDVLAFKKRLYFLTTLMYRDKNMLADSVGITEWCGWFAGDLINPHDCGRKASIIHLPRRAN